MHRILYSISGSDAKDLYEQLSTVPDTAELESYDVDYNANGRPIITLRFADFD